MKERLLKGARTTLARYKKVRLRWLVALVAVAVVVSLSFGVMETFHIALGLILEEVCMTLAHAILGAE